MLLFEWGYPFDRHKAEDCELLCAFAEQFLVINNRRHNPSTLDMVVSRWKKGVWFDMTEKGKKSNGSASKRAFTGKTRWINISIEGKHIAACKRACEDRHAVALELGSIIIEGYGFSHKRDGGTGKWTVCLFPPNDSEQAGKFALSAYATELPVAVGVLLYKFRVILGSEWPSSDPESDGMDFG